MTTTNKPVSHSTKHVVIVGAGFAGLHCAQALSGAKNVQVTLLDRNNYQQFQPLLYQVATASLAPNRAAFNLRTVLLKHPNIDVQMTDIVAVDLAKRTVTGRDGDTYAGDYLVLAAGAQANFFSIPGVENFAFPMYTLTDAERLRSRIIEVFEATDRAIARGEPAVAHLTVIGGGPTGVEVAGAVADICHRAPNALFKHFRLQDVVVTLINGKNELLSGFTDKSKAYAKQSLEKRGVRLCLNKEVTELTNRDILLADGTRQPCSLAIWAGGLKAAPLAGSLGLEPGKGGRVDVQPDLSVAGFLGVYALGDFANAADGTGQLLPQLASVAQQAGRHCARNIKAHVDGLPTSTFVYFDKGIMAMIGRNAAVAEVGPKHRSITGFIAFGAWLGVHALLLTTLPATLAACVEWVWNYFGGMNVEAIMDAPTGSPPEVSSRPRNAPFGTGGTWNQ